MGQLASVASNLDSEDRTGFETRKALWERLQADPEGYESNRDFGLYCAMRRKYLAVSKPYLLKALSYEREDEATKELLFYLAEFYKLTGRYDLAYATFHDLRRRYPQVVNYAIFLADMDYALGRIKEASEGYRTSMDIMAYCAKAVSVELGEPDKRLLLPNGLIYEHIGETAHKLDLFVKARAMGLIEDFEAVVVAPEDKTANMALMQCYSKYVTLVTDPDAADAAMDEFAKRRYHLDYLTMPNGLTLHREQAYGVLQRMWSDQGRPPPLVTPDGIRERGWDLLRRLGAPKNAWFAALHVREPGFYEEDVAWDHNRYRNGRIVDYLDAIRAITDRGGWVLRLGDPTMTPLPEMDRVIDYALSEHRSDWMDVFGMSQCRFFVGTTSGPMNVARAFCVPVAATNYFAAGTWPFSLGDVFIHKLHRSKTDGRLLSLRKALEPPLLAAWNPMVYDACDVEVLDNSPEDIRDAVIEMMDMLDGTYTESQEVARLKKVYRTVADPYGLGFLLPVASSFLERNPHLLREVEG